MTTRSEKYRYVQDETNSRVIRNQELYNQIYADDSYFQDEKPSLEQTNEIDINKVKELLKGREIYRREMKMRELNMIKPDDIEEKVESEEYEEKNYDINAFLNKASQERETEPYHKIDPDILKQSVVEEDEEDDEPDEKDLKDMGTTELSLNMYGDLSETRDLSDTDETQELVATITKTDTFFTDSVKLEVTDDDEDGEEKSSVLVKVIMALLIVVIIGLVIFLILM